MPQINQDKIQRKCEALLFDQKNLKHSKLTHACCFLHLNYVKQTFLSQGSMFCLSSTRYKQVHLKGTYLFKNNNDLRKEKPCPNNKHLFVQCYVQCDIINCDFTLYCTLNMDDKILKVDQQFRLHTNITEPNSL